MKPPTSLSGKALASMWMSSTFFADLLVLNEPDEMAKHLCEKLGELTGAKTVAFILHSDSDLFCQPLYIDPPSAAPLFRDGKLSLLCSSCHPDPIPLIVKNLSSDAPLRTKLGEAGFKTLLRLPIHGRSLTGTFVIADLEDPGLADEINSIMEALGPTIGLAIENCEARQIIHEQRNSLEAQMEARTAELENLNQELSSARLAALNMMEDAVLANQRLELTQFAMDHADTATFWIGKDASIRYANRAACQNLGYTQSQLTRLSIPDIDPGMPMECWSAHWSKAKERKSMHFESCHMRRDGSIFPVEIYSSFIEHGGEEYHLSYAHDISARKEADRALRESRVNLEITLKSIGDAVISTDTAGLVTLMNPVAEALTGWTQADAAGKPLEEVFRIINEDSCNPVETPVAKVIETGHIVGLANHTLLISKDGREIPIADSAAPIKNEEGSIAGVVLVFRDQTEERTARQALELSAKRLQRAQAVAKLGDWEFDLENRIVHASAEARNIYGLGNQELGLDDIKKIPLPEYRETLDQALRDLIHHAHPYDTEFRIKRPSDGRLADIHSIAEYNPETQTVFGIIQDVTERKQLESQLRQTQFAVDHLADAAYWCNQDGRLVYVNQASCLALGYTREELLHMHISEVDSRVAPETWPEFWTGYQQNRHTTIESLHRRKDGSSFPVEIRVNYLEFEGVQLVCGFAHDITNRKQAEKKILFEQSLFKSFMDAIPANILFKDLDGKFVKANKNILEGRSEEELIGKSDIDFIPADQIPVLRQTELDAMRREQPIQIEELAIDRWYSTTKAPLYDESGALSGIFSISWDITEKKRLQDAVEKRILALTRPLDSSDGIVFEELFDLDEIQRIQDEFAAATGVASIITKTDGTPITRPSNFTRLCNDIIRNAEKGCANCFKSDATIGRHHPDGPIVQPCLSGGLWDAGVSITVGDRHIANWLIGQVRDETQTDEHMRAYAQEIGADEAKFMEAFHNVPVMSREHFEKIAQALFTLANQLSTSAYQNIQQARFIADETRRTEELQRLSTVIEQSPEITVITDKDGTIQYANPAFESTTGFPVAEALGQNPRLLKSGKHPASFYEELWKTISSGSVWTGHIVDKRKNGSFFTVEACIAPVIDLKGRITNYVSHQRDITQELAREEELQQAQKMDAVGQLAGGIAHDFNNILQGILGFSQLLESSLDKESEEYDNAREIKKAAKRAAELTRQLLTFSRKQPVQISRIDLNDVVHDSEALLDMLLGERFEVVFDLADDPPPIGGDQGQLSQIIMNLAVNARDAMPEGGRLTIKTQAVQFNGQDAASVRDARPGSFVCLSVADTGTGMDKYVMEHLFEPFFTTKDVGRGTGLGLSVVYGIVKQNKGWINVFSEMGQGSSFKIYFPAQIHPAEQPANSDPADTAKHPLRILIVEDDRDVALMLMEVLQGKGFLTSVAASAEEGVELFYQQDGCFDLLISDMELPGMRGDQLADMLRQTHPSLPVLLCSGYPAHTARWRELNNKNYFFETKPFTENGIIDIICEIFMD